MLIFKTPFLTVPAQIFPNASDSRLKISSDSNASFLTTLSEILVSLSPVKLSCMTPILVPTHMRFN